VLVHLAREDDAHKMLKRGIRVGRGVYCLPLLDNYFVSHQWLREMKRRGAPTLVAVDFRLPDEERVLVGRFNTAHQDVTLGTAIRQIREAPDPRGFEIIALRAIAAKEILRIRAVPQVSGWRYYPEAKGTRPSAPAVTATAGRRRQAGAGVRTTRASARRACPSCCVVSERRTMRCNFRRHSAPSQPNGGGTRGRLSS